VNRKAMPLMFLLVSRCVFDDMAIERAMDTAALQHGCPREQVRLEGDGGNWTYWFDVCGRRRLYDTRDARYHDITSSVE